MKKCNNCNEKDCKVRNMAEETLDESRRVEGNKKGFRLVITSLDTGETLVDEKTRAIVGAMATNAGENSVNCRGIIVSSCSTKTLIGAIDSAEKTIAQAKKKVVEGFDAKDIMGALLASLFGGDDE